MTQAFEALPEANEELNVSDACIDAFSYAYISELEVASGATKHFVVRDGSDAERMRLETHNSSMDIEIMRPMDGIGHRDNRNIAFWIDRINMDKNLLVHPDRLVITADDLEHLYKHGHGGESQMMVSEEETEQIFELISTGQPIAISPRNTEWMP